MAQVAAWQNPVMGSLKLLLGSKVLNLVKIGFPAFSRGVGWGARVGQGGGHLHEIVTLFASGTITIPEGSD